MIAARSSEVWTCLPPIDLITSPFWMPACWAGLPDWVPCTLAPNAVPLADPGTLLDEMPRYACETLPLCSSCGITVLARSTGIAKPTPLLDPSPLAVLVLVAICALMPTTWPLALSSGPPELPGLMEASVWIEPSMPKPLGAWMLRSSPETMPSLKLFVYPNGLPSAYTVSPTFTLLELASVSGCRSSPDGSILITARSVDGSVPTTVAVRVILGWLSNETVTFVALSTTCSFVRMSPLPSSRMPLPRALPPPPPNGLLVPLDCVEMIDTTPV